MITDDPLGVFSSWNDSVHFCEWYGVSCSKRHHSRVTVLNLSAHRLYGSISPHVGNLSFLKVLYLFNNSFMGEIPPEIGQLHRLERLSLRDNLLDGKIPSNISRCSALTYFDVYNNKMVGGLPWQLGLLSKLQYFIASSNNLSGSIPFAFGNLSSLLVFHGGDNKLSGSIPNTLGRLKGLMELYLGPNILSGEIPTSIFNLTSLTDLWLGFNQLHGSLPWNLGTSLPNLENFDVAFNLLSGSVPPSLSNASNLVLLQLSSNNFTGSMPSMADSNKLVYFRAPGNSLGSGKANDLSFLSSLTNATNLVSLDIQANNFGGRLPQNLGNLSISLKRLALNNNKIFGNIPSGIQYLVNLAEFWAYDNDLTGTIPSNIGKLKSLEVLDLGNNNLFGYIPSSMGNLTRLTNLNISSNYLFGEIPASIRNCKQLTSLYISRNNLSGVIPPQLLSLTSLSIALDLSGNRFTGALPMELGNLKNLEYLNLSHNMLSSSIPSSLGSCIKLYTLCLDDNHLQGIIPSSTFVGSCCFILLIKQRRRQDKSSTDDPKLLQLSYQRLFKATDGFSLANQIGVGSFGSRLNVAIDIASAVDYLHNNCGTPIVHCDIKPSNVLLDEDMVAHVGDFGLARFLSTTIGIKGTVGYAPPEYGMGNEVSIQGDIYSYGILLLELFTGKRPTDETFKDGLSLHNIVKSAMSEQNTSEVVDPILLSELLRRLTSHHNHITSNSSKARKDLEELMSSILEIGIACSSDFPQERASMSEVLSSLTAIKTSLVGRR
ncbi:Probable LRR receptor-like serine/threonine-protein kinase At3g47570 [Linum perenne]